MPSHVLSTRVPPDIYARLQALAAQRGQSLAGCAAALLSTAVDQAGTPGAQQPDGPLALLVRETLADVTAPGAVLRRETALTLAYTIDRRERGHVGAVALLHTEITRARSEQEHADSPDPFDWLT